MDFLRLLGVSETGSDACRVLPWIPPQAGLGLEPKRDRYGVLVSFDPCNDRRNSARRLPPVTIPKT